MSSISREVGSGRVFVGLRTDRISFTSCFGQFDNWVNVGRVDYRVAHFNRFFRSSRVRLDRVMLISSDRVGYNRL